MRKDFPYKHELMIHKFHKEMLNLPLHRYTISFDDGLASQVDGIYQILDKFPGQKIMYYTSTNLINHDASKVSYDESDVAQEKARHEDLSNFITYDDLIKISKLPTVTVGLHGHNHLDIERIKHNNSFKDAMDIIRRDIIEMVFRAINLYELRVINDDVIHYCRPYNQRHEVVDAMIRKELNLYFPKAEVIFHGSERRDVFDLPGFKPDFNSRYSEYLSEPIKDTKRKYLFER